MILLTTVIVAFLCLLEIISIKVHDDCTKICLHPKKYVKSVSLKPITLSKEREISDDAIELSAYTFPH